VSTVTPSDLSNRLPPHAAAPDSAPAGRRGPVVVVALTMVLLLLGGAACDATRGTAGLARWTAPGPHAVGVTRSIVERPATAGEGQRRLETVIWYPARGPRWSPAGGGVPRTDATVARGGPFPVVIFSHGSGGIPEQSPALVAHLASHGFVVVAPPHPGNTFGDCAPTFCLEPDRLRASLAERPDDVRAVLDHLPALAAREGSPVRGALALDRIGVMGHSLGGATALLVAGRDERVHAVIALAPAVFGDVIDAARTLSVPVLIMNGDADVLTRLDGARRLYESLPAATPRALVTLLGGDHLLFTRLHVAVNGYAAAYLRFALGNDREAAKAINPAQPALGTRVEAAGLP
jgi:predicted dienelactone hydrolase